MGEFTLGLLVAGALLGTALMVVVVRHTLLLRQWQGELWELQRRVAELEDGAGAQGTCVQVVTGGGWLALPVDGQGR